MSEAGVLIPKLTTRVSYVIGALPFLATLAAAGYVALTDPEYLKTAIISLPAIWLVFIAMIWTSVTVYPQRGTIVARRMHVFTRVVALDQVVKVAVAGNRAGAVLLGFKTAQLGRLYIPVLHVTDDVKKSLDPARLTLLADLIAQWIPEGVPGKAETITALRSQAAFVGRPEQSPLAPMASAELLRLGQATGTATTIVELLK